MTSEHEHEWETVDSDSPPYGPVARYCVTCGDVTTSTFTPGLTRLLDQSGASYRTAEAFQAIHRAAMLVVVEQFPEMATNSPVADELARIDQIGQEYEADGEHIWEDIMERYTPEQFEAALS